MSITIGIPSGTDAIEYLTSFEAALTDYPEMRAALLGIKDSLRQALLLIGEPLGLLACLTAEEEAASFLYYCLIAKGYSVPKYGKIQRHNDKLKLLVFAVVMQKYFFTLPAELEGTIRIERDGQKPKTSFVFTHGNHTIVQEDFLETIVTQGEGEDGHDHAVRFAVDDVLKHITPTGFTIGAHITKMANRRNFCLYGDPEKKQRLRSALEIDHFRANCVCMIVLGFLVSNSGSLTTSMIKLVAIIFDKISS
ncbi:hypothetical protein FS815_07500 [Agrobacterium vitis]|uniref:hypothetical protein n=1 Tax=Allorhizobium ampelinum TaxID=3025782 RepID=UPI001F2540CF|nr:hypothetical protein [Allorhizobium ampelinum]MCF1446669.1 hypothetical protein [Allorhizobium ampelinum]